jgi:integrase
MARKGEKEPDFEQDSTFSFTPARVERLRRLVSGGEISLDRANRRQWRDASCPGLVVVVSRGGKASWQIYRKVDGSPRRKKIGDVDSVQLSDAREAVNRERYDSSVAGKIIGPARNGGENITVQQLFDAYIDAAESGDFIAGNRRKRISKETGRFYRELYRAQLKIHAAKTMRWLAQETPVLFKRLGQGSNPHPYQANRLLTLLRIMFEFASREGWWTAPSPCVDPRTGRSLRRYEEPHRTRYCSDDEWIRLETSLRGESRLWQDFFVFVISTGVRMRGVRRAKWSEIDFARKEWNVPRERMKGAHKSHAVVLDHAVIQMLKRRQRENSTDSIYVFPAPRSFGTQPLEAYKNAWKRVLTKSGLHSDNRQERLRPHDLRRTFATTAITAGVDVRTVNTLLGNSDSSVGMTAKVYAHVTDDHRRNASEQLHAARKRNLEAARSRITKSNRAAKKRSKRS